MNLSGVRSRKALALAVGLNAGLAIPWWILLRASPEFRRVFLPAGYPDSALFAYELADAVLFIGAGLLAAYGCWSSKPWADAVLLVHLGAASYASLVTLHQFLITGAAAWSAIAMFPSLLLAIAVWASRLSIRVARPASSAWNLAKTLLQTLILWTLALWAAPRMILLGEQHLNIPGFPPFFFAGCILFAAASTLGLWSAWTMAWHGRGTPLPLDTARELVIRGPYRWVRNPMAVAGIAQGIAVGVMTGSAGVILYSLAGAMLWQWVARPVEESDLLARFGEPYAAYRRAVPCWTPRRPAGGDVIKL